jgi:DNA-binding LytR/AlgR family response regulator
MSKLKVAILEDNTHLLKDLKESLEETSLVEVVAYATTSSEFLDKVSNTKPEALLLDIDLGGDSMNGLDIANKLKVPVLFVSGKTIEFNHGIEELNMNTSIPVQHISKPITSDKLKKILPKFINEINAVNNARFVYLDIGESKRSKISVDTIVFIETDTGKSGESNNKRIYFTNNKPETLFNFSLSKIEEKGFDKTKFIKIRGSHRVNVDKILRYNNNHEIEVEAMNEKGKLELKKLPVSEDFRKDVSRFKK